jgi:hypothetical protein
VSWERDILGNMREVHRPVHYEFRELSAEEALREAAGALRAMQLERQREDCLLRFGIRRPLDG